MNIPRILQNLNLSDGLVVREATAEDQVFLKSLFCATRDYLYSLPLPQAQLDVLVQQQFLSQQIGYAEQFPRAVNCIIERKGASEGNKSVGKLMLAEFEKKMHIVDVALLPEVRSQGCGTGLLRQLQQHAGAENHMISLAVDRQNIRAKQFYVALGFKCIATSETHETMVWQGALEVRE